MSELITADFVNLDLDGLDRHEAVRTLSGPLVKAGRVTDLEGFLADVRAREEQMATGLEGGVGIPHCRSAHVTEPTLAVGRSKAGVDFGAKDGPSHLIFLIAAPASGGQEHMKILSKLARRLVHASFKESLLNAENEQKVADIVTQEVVNR